MKRQTVGLVGAGKFADATLFRALTLAGRLGPVKAPSVRVASRIANRLRAGHPVPVYDDFEHCSLILISVPDSSLAATVSELASQRLSWETKAVVLCSGLLGSQELRKLAVRGAHAGSLCAVPGFEHHWLLLEGDRLVEAQVSPLVDARISRMTLIQTSRKPSYLDALACTGPLFVPMLFAASDALRRAGVSSAHARAILEKQIERSTRAYFKAGRKTSADPRIAGWLEEMLRAN